MLLLPPQKLHTKQVCGTFKDLNKNTPEPPLPADVFTPPSRVSVSLVFFASYLFELDTIKSYGTIRNYMSHVKQFYVKKGYPKKKLESPLLKAVMRGVKRCMPPKADSRVAFLLIHYQLPRQ